ncbi:hypothetical protein ACN6LM_007100 [Streptomyces sp. SAS_281]
MNLRLRDDRTEALKQRAEQEGTSMHAVLLRAVDDYLARTAQQAHRAPDGAGAGCQVEDILVIGEHACPDMQIVLRDAAEHLVIAVATGGTDEIQAIAQGLRELVADPV